MKKVLILYVSVHHGNTRQVVGNGKDLDRAAAFLRGLRQG